MKTVRDYAVARRTALVIALLLLLTCAKTANKSSTKMGAMSATAAKDKAHTEMRRGLPPTQSRLMRLPLTSANLRERCRRTPRRLYRIETWRTSMHFFGHGRIPRQ